MAGEKKEICWSVLSAAECRIADEKDMSIATAPGSTHNLNRLTV